MYAFNLTVIGSGNPFGSDHMPFLDLGGVNQVHETTHKTQRTRYQHKMTPPPDQTKLMSTSDLMT